MRVMPRVGRPLSAALWTSVLFCLAQCSVQTIELKPGPARPPTGALEVVAAGVGVEEPLPVSGSRLVFAQVCAAASDAIATACGAWARRHRLERPGGWQLQVELVRAQATRLPEQVEVELEARVTLRARAGRAHLGQTRGYCKVQGPAEALSKVMTQCLERMAADLAGWLEGVQP